MALHQGERFVRSGSEQLCVREYGDGGPHVVLVHGYPDDQTLWDGVVALLDGAHLVTYDVRGAGRSSAPPRVRDYGTDRLSDDLLSVVEATVPAGQPFHLVGHDWGSVQGWDAVVDPRLAGRIASFVSASGPSLDHVAASLRGRPPRGLPRQLVRSSYLLAYQVPWLPERLWRSEHRLTPALLRVLAEQEGATEWSPRLGRNAANGVQLYRANVLPKMLRPRPQRVDIPVLLVVATHDVLIGSFALDVVDRHCSDVRRVHVDAGHWHPSSRPELMAGVLAEHLGLQAGS